VSVVDRAAASREVRPATGAWAALVPRGRLRVERSAAAAAGRGRPDDRWTA